MYLKKLSDNIILEGLVIVDEYGQHTFCPCLILDREEFINDLQKACEHPLSGLSIVSSFIRGNNRTLLAFINELNMKAQGLL